MPLASVGGKNIKLKTQTCSHGTIFVFNTNYWTLFQTLERSAALVCRWHKEYKGKLPATIQKEKEMNRQYTKGSFSCYGSFFLFVYAMVAIVTYWGFVIWQPIDLTKLWRREKSLEWKLKWAPTLFTNRSFEHRLGSANHRFSSWHLIMWH